MGGRVSSATFVGRRAELDGLDALLRAVEADGVTTVLIGGDAGIGKSRLLEEFCAGAARRGALVAVGACTPTEGGGLPYGAVVGLLRDAARQLPAADADDVIGPAHRLLGLSPLGTDPDTAGTGSLAKTRLFEELLRCVTSLSERSPVVLVFEDLQWADSASAEVVDFLTRNLTDRPVLIVATYRADEIDRARLLRHTLAELGRHARVRELELGGLDRLELADLLAHILGERPSWALVDAVHTRSEGNPFFAEELAAARNATSMPKSLRNVVTLRIERLSPDARHVVALAASAGTSIDHRLLAAACRLHSDLLDAALADAVDTHVLVPSTDGRSFGFRHALLREAAYDALLPGERSRLHHALARALTDHPELAAAGPGHVAMELADHWWEAGDYARAFEAALAAATSAAGLLAMPEAYAYYERALSAAESMPAESRPASLDLVDLLMRTADAAYLRGATERSVALAQQALQELGSTDDSRRLATCYTMLGRNAWAAGQSQLASQSLRLAAAKLPSAPSVQLAAVLAEDARRLMLMAHYDDAMAKCHDALAVARAVDARAEEGHALNTLGCCVVERQDIEHGVALVREALVIAEAIGRPDQLDRAYANLSHVLMQAGRLEEAARLVYDGANLVEDVSGVRTGAAAENSAEALIRLGRWDDAEDLLGRMLQRGVSSCVFGPHAARAMMSIRRGRFDDAAGFLAAAAEMSAGVDTVQVRGGLLMMRAELHLEQNEPRAAMQLMEEALAIAAASEDAVPQMEMYALALRAVADDVDNARARGRRIDAEKVRRTAAGLRDEAAELLDGRRAEGRPLTPRLLAFAAVCRAEASRADTSDARLWEAAAEQWQEASEPYPMAYCRWREAEALLSGRTERRRAADALLSAWRTTLQLGAPVLQLRIEGLARRARIPLSAAEAADIPVARTVADDLGLTPREVEVLTRLVRGRTDRQIADELFISKKTASVHVSNLLRKLDAANRVDAAEIGQHAGLS